MCEERCALGLRLGERIHEREPSAFRKCVGVQEQWDDR